MGNEQQTYSILHPKNVVIHQTATTISISGFSDITASIPYSEMNIVFINSFVDVNIPFKICVKEKDVKFEEIPQQ